jgi:hypothetical protein
LIKNKDFQLASCYLNLADKLEDSLFHKDIAKFVSLTAKEAREKRERELNEEKESKFNFAVLLTLGGICLFLLLIYLILMYIKNKKINFFKTIGEFFHEFSNLYRIPKGKIYRLRLINCVLLASIFVFYELLIKLSELFLEKSNIGNYFYSMFIQLCIGFALVRFHHFAMDKTGLTKKIHDEKK